MKTSKKRVAIGTFMCFLCASIGALSGIIPSTGAKNIRHINQIRGWCPPQTHEGQGNENSSVSKPEIPDNCKLKSSSLGISSSSSTENKSTHTPQNKKHSQQFYRTKTGKCYHKNGCPCLRHSKIKVSQTEISDAELKPCSKCL